MLAARLHAWDGEPVVEEVDLPRAGDGESVVALTAASVAHIDLTVASGTFAYRPTLPWIPGTEGAGRVIASGRFAVGTAARIRGAGVGLARDGTWAQAARVPDEALQEIPAGVDPQLAAAFFSPAVTAYAAVTELAAVRPGERVAVIGAAGAVGSLVTQLAREAGADVVAVEAPGKLGLLGPDVNAVAELAETKPVDVLIDMAGGEALARRVTDGVKPGGRAVLVGYAAGTTATFDLPALLAADVRLIPMNLIRWGPRLTGAAGALLTRLAAGELRLPLTVLELSRIADAVRLVREGAAIGRVVVRIPTLE